MKLDGVNGTVETGPYAGWFPINSFQWGSGKGVSDGRWGRRRNNNNNADNDKPPKRTCSEPSYSEMTVTKSADGSSAFLLATMALNSCFSCIEIHMVAEDGLILAQFRLFEVMISGFSSSGETDLSESISLNFVAFQMTTRSLLRSNSTSLSTLFRLDPANLQQRLYRDRLARLPVPKRHIYRNLLSSQMCALLIRFHPELNSFFLQRPPPELLDTWLRLI